MDINFWKNKKISEFSDEEWEAVCLRCGKCCLEKLSDGRRVYFTNEVCDGYDLSSGLCKRYKNRLCASCVKVDFKLLQTRPELLPETCAYRLLLAGQELPKFHPLVSQNPNSVHEAGQTVVEMPNIRYGEDRKEVSDELFSYAILGGLVPFTVVLEKLKVYGITVLESYEIPN